MPPMNHRDAKGGLAAAFALRSARHARFLLA